MAALPSKIKPKLYECPLVAGCSTAYKACVLPDGKWDEDKHFLSS